MRKFGVIACLAALIGVTSLSAQEVQPQTITLRVSNTTGQDAHIMIFCYDDRVMRPLAYAADGEIATFQPRAIDFCYEGKLAVRLAAGRGMMFDPPTVPWTEVKALYLCLSPENARMALYRSTELPWMCPVPVEPVPRT